MVLMARQRPQLPRTLTKLKAHCTWTGQGETCSLASLAGVVQVATALSELRVVASKFDEDASRGGLGNGWTMMSQPTLTSELPQPWQQYEQYLVAVSGKPLRAWDTLAWTRSYSTFSHTLRSLVQLEELRLRVRGGGALQISFESAISSLPKLKSLAIRAGGDTYWGMRLRSSSLETLQLEDCKGVYLDFGSELPNLTKYGKQGDTVASFPWVDGSNSVQTTNFSVPAHEYLLEVLTTCCPRIDVEDLTLRDEEASSMWRWRTHDALVTQFVHDADRVRELQAWSEQKRGQLS